MATFGWNPRRVHVFVVLFVTVFSFAAVVHARTEENSFVVSRHRAEGSLSVVVGGSSPCDSAVEVQSDEPLIRSVTSEDAADVASNLSKGPCIRQTMSCPVKCFRSYPVCGTDKVTYWCGAADANCAGVEVAHDGFCNPWEGDKNVGSSTALYAVQSLQLVHMLWLVFAGSFVVLGML